MYNTPVLAFVRERDIARLLGRDIATPPELAREVAEFDRQTAIYGADRRAKKWALYTAGGWHG